MDTETKETLKKIEKHLQAIINGLTYLAVEQNPALKGKSGLDPE